MKKLLHIIIIIVLCALAPKAQDLGVPDTLKFIGDTLILGQSIPIELTIVNDIPIAALSNGFIVRTTDSGYAKFDSVVFINRMSDPTVLDFRTMQPLGDNLNGPDLIQFGGFRFLGNFLPVGNNPVCLAYFTGMRIGSMEIDSSFVEPTTYFQFIDENSKKFTPQFSKKSFTIVSGSVQPTISISDSLVQTTINSLVELTILAESQIEAGLNIEIVEFRKFDNDDIPEGESSITSNNPAMFNWTPSSNDIGIWKAVFGACDSLGNCVEESIVIEIVENDNYLISFNVHQNETVTMPTTLNCVDTDNDGYSELAISGFPHRNSGMFVLYELDLNSNIISKEFELNDPTTLRGTQFGYINSDNYLDFIGVPNRSYLGEIHYNNQNNTFDLSDEVINVNDFTKNSSVLEELNNDQYLDYVSLEKFTLNIDFGTGSGVWIDGFSMTFDEEVKTINSADFNQDGYIDLAVGTIKGIYILLNDKISGFTNNYFYEQTYGIVDIEITNKGSDFNNDNRFDLCMSVPSVGGEYSELVAYMGKTTGDFFKNNITTVRGHIHGNTTGDFNGDGLLDIAFINGSQSYFSILFGDGDGEFTNALRFQIPLNETPALIESIDLDLDGDLDLVITTSNIYADNFIYHYYNQSNPSGMNQVNFNLDCNNNAALTLLTPSGKEISKIKNTIPSATLSNKNIDNNNSLDTYLKVNVIESGSYKLVVKPKPELSATALFSAEFTINDEKYSLAKNIPMSEAGYTFLIYPSGNSPVNPIPGQFIGEKQPLFTWENSGEVNFQLASDIDYSQLIIDSTLTGNNLQVLSDLSVTDTTAYYWRVKPTIQSNYEGIYVFKEVFKIATDIDDDINGLPIKFSLSQNYPNPFNPNTQLNFSLPERSHVTMEIFNIVGQKIRTLTDKEYQAGEHFVEWDGNDMAGRKTASGVYLMKFTTEKYTESIKMLMMK